MDDDARLATVSSMHVRCSFPMRPDALAASDYCGHHAVSTVKMPDGSRMWRCPDHRGERWPEGHPHPFGPGTSRWGRVSVVIARASDD